MKRLGLAPPCLALLLLVGLVTAVAPAATAQDRVAQLNAVTGEVAIHRAADGSIVQPRQVGPRVRESSVYPGDVISTKADATAKIEFTDGSEIEMRADTSLTIQEVDFSALMAKGAKDKATGRVVKVLAGNIWTHVVPNPQIATEFETPSGVAAVKGTTLEITVDSEGRASLHMDTGTVDFVSNVGGVGIASITLGDGRQITVYRHPDGSLEVENPDASPIDVKVGDSTVAISGSTARLTPGEGGQMSIQNSGGGSVNVNGAPLNPGGTTQARVSPTTPRPPGPDGDGEGRGSDTSCGECGTSDGANGCIYVNSNCPEGKKCLNGLCVAATTATCNATNCPPPNFTCQGAVCVALGSCMGDADCAAFGTGFRCVENRCSRASTPGVRVTCTGCALPNSAGTACVGASDRCAPLGLCVLTGNSGACAVACGGCARPNAARTSCEANPTGCATGETCRVSGATGTCVPTTTAANCTGCAVANGTGGCIGQNGLCAPSGTCSVAGTVGTCSVSCGGCAFGNAAGTACLANDAACLPLGNCLLAGTTGTCAVSCSGCAVAVGGTSCVPNNALCATFETCNVSGTVGTCTEPTSPQ